jgi:YidC/Oxa1 family membrane protein insertase
LSRLSKASTKWSWALAAVAMMSLTGCSMYPSKPGAWPGGLWGEALRFVSSTIDFFAKYVGYNYGIALLIVTVLVRLLVLPLMVKQIRYSKMMQELQPDIQKLRQKHKGDAKKVQEETMKLWQRHGVNPMSGCLPMVVQLPVLYALFGAIEGNIKLNNSTFLYIFHMGHPDHTYILPIIAAITTYFSSKVMMAGNDSQQKMMLFIMPVFIFFIGSRFAAGLALYWIYSNIFTTVQTYFIKVRPARAAGASDK